MNADKKRIQELEQEVAELKVLVVELRKIIELQAKELVYYRNKKDSNNSSIPPSQDPFRIKRTESLREKSGKKPGGQQGHEGKTLEMVENPDSIVKHTPKNCTCCGKDLSEIPSIFVGKRQVLDIPKIEYLITEHQIFGKQCICGHYEKSAYPIQAHSPICYGENIMTISAYLNSRQYVSYERMQEMFKDVFNVPISQGTLVNLVKKFAKKCTPIYEQIRCRIEKSKLVGADETSVCVNGKNHWAWTFQNPNYTYIHIDESRGRKAIDKVFKHGFPFASLLSDCWSPYFVVNCQSHQLCFAHLLRELNYFEKSCPDEDWVKSIQTLFLEALQLKRELKPIEYYYPNEKRNTLESHLEALLKYELFSDDKKLLAFKKRLVKNKDSLFLFLHRYDIPPDNNSSERVVRTFKVKQKVSGLFRSKEGANCFAMIRSVMDTTIKNSQNVFNGMTLIAKS